VADRGILRQSPSRIQLAIENGAKTKLNINLEKAKRIETG
jgi:hypothetical protein